MVRLYGPPQNLSLAEIGARCGGISRQAVQKRLAKAGVERRDSAGARALRYEAWATSRVKSIERALQRTRDPAELAAKLDVPLIWIRRYLEQRFGTTLLVPEERELLFSDVQLLDALRSAHETSGNGRISAVAYDALRAADGPTAATLVDRFGSWTEACAAASVAPHETRRVYEPTWQPDDVLRAVREYAEECKTAGRRPTALDYDKRWRAEHSAPSIGTVRKLYRSWRDALCEALL